MKRRILVLIMAILCLSLVFALASCGGGSGDNGDNGECNHTFGEWEVVEANSCTSAGLEKRVCSQCGEEETQTIKAAHSFGEWTVTKNATCSEDGSKVRVCSVCGNDETEKIFSEGHKEKITTEAKEPTADANGCTKGSECEFCGEVMSVSQTLTKLGNIATPEGTTVIKGEAWHSFNDNKKYMFDGNSQTAPSSPKNDYTLSIALKDGAYIYDVLVVCNGGGTVHTSGGASEKEDAARISAIKITCFKDGKEVVSELVEDATTIKEVKIEGVNTYIDTIEIEVVCGANNKWGDAYIWEINAYGTAPLKACEIAGHEWGDWNITKQPECTEENVLTDGEKVRECSVCGEKEKETIKAAHDFSEWGFDANGGEFVFEPQCSIDGSKGRECKVCYYAEYEVIPTTIHHVWSEWNTENVDCENGGEKTRVCTNEGCGKTEKETVPAGTHANVVVEGYVAPTVDAEGQTGVSKCTVCGTVIEQSKVITKIVNEALNGTGSTNQTHTTVISNPDTRPYLNDGKLSTGMTSHGQNKEVEYIVSWETAVSVNKVIVYFNGDGTDKTLGQGNYNLGQTNSAAKMIMIVYDANGRALTSESFAATDLTSYEIKFDEDVSISKVVVKATTSWNMNNCALNVWEIEAISGGIVTDEIVCNHDWNDWEEISAPGCGIDGLEKRTCKLCSDSQENVIDRISDHVWGEWTYSEGFSCTEGGTRERACKNEGCGKTETETTVAGEHIEIVTEGYVAPTTEAEGATGTTKCTVCGQTISENKTITKLVNVATGATVTTTNTHWHVTAQNGSSGLAAVVDGKKDNGSASDPSAHNVVLKIEFAEACDDLNKIVLTVNGSGYVPAIWGTYENTNNKYNISFVVCDESGAVIYTSEQYNTLDKTEIVVDLNLADGVKAKSITITRSSDTSNNILWEVEAFSGGTIVE